MVNARVAMSPKLRELEVSRIYCELTVDGSMMEPSDSDVDESLPPQLFQTPQLSRADLRTFASYADSPPRLSRRKRTNEHGATGDASASQSASRTASELEINLSPITLLSFDDNDFILAVPSEIGMVSRGTSLDPHDLYSKSNHSVEDLPRGAAINVSMESQYHDETRMHSFRPIRDLGGEADDEGEGAFDLPMKRPREGFRLLPRHSRYNDASSSVCTQPFR
jgi:hypothetical protein